MKIMVMGTGGMGGYYGGLLSQKGHEVTFIARGEHLATIQKNGLQVTSIHGDFTVSPANATDDPTQAGTPDLILFCTKTYSTDEGVKKIKPIVGANTTVLSLQNGIDAAERIGKVVGMEHMIGGATWISSAVTGPGVIKQVSEFRRVVIGELNGKRTPRVEAIHEAFHQSGITAEISENILGVMWTKFIFISAASSFGSLTRLPIGGYRGVPETRVLIMQLVREVEALARPRAFSLRRMWQRARLHSLTRTDRRSSRPCSWMWKEAAERRSIPSSGWSAARVVKPGWPRPWPMRSTRFYYRWSSPLAEHSTSSTDHDE